MEVMCREAGIHEKKANHSLRATGASVLFNAGVPEKLIRDVTGHRSNALQLYERPTIQQKQSVSKILVQGGQKFNSEVNIPVQTHSTVTSPSNVFGSIFSGVKNCISPHSFSVNICPLSAAPPPQSGPDLDLEALLQGVDAATVISHSLACILYYYCILFVMSDLFNALPLGTCHCF